MRQLNGFSRFAGATSKRRRKTSEKENAGTNLLEHGFAIRSSPAEPRRGSSEMGNFRIGGKKDVNV